MENAVDNQIIEFCKTPRTLKEVCRSYHLTQGQGYNTLTWMVYRGFLKEEVREGVVMFRTPPTFLPADIGM